VIKAISSKVASMTAAKPQNPLHQHRVLVVGSALASAAAPALQGADLTVGGLDQLSLGIAVSDLILIDADSCTTQALAAGVTALAACPAPPPVLLVGERLPTTVVRNLLRLDRSDVLEAPFTTEAMQAAITALLTETIPAPVSHHAAGGARCWAVIGAVGGAGATTIALEIATALCARERKSKSVCLIDLHLADGSAAAYLGAHPAMRLGDLGHAERIDAAMLQAFITPVTDELDLLAAERHPDAFEAIPSEALLKVLEIACETYDWVILDMPRHRRAWTLEALGGCDEVLVISELTVPALIAARSLSDEIETGLEGGLQPRIVLNRLASRMFGPAPSMAEAERALQRKAEAGVSSDWEAAAASVNLGGPIATHRPKSKIVKDIQLLVERLASAQRAPAGKRAA